MARIYDNIDIQFTEGLKGIISNQGVKRADFCVGYFNLRGWDLIVDQVDHLPGEEIYEGNERRHRVCRLLIGMHRPDEELIRALYSHHENLPDAAYVAQCKLRIAQDFRNQLRWGLPSKKDEETLQHLSRQLREGKVCVKLYLKEALHAKLYLAHRPDDHFNAIQAIMGSSNLTYAGLTHQGELNAEFADSDSAQKLATWFDNRWNDRFCLDITRELAAIIDESWAGERDVPPYYIYLMVAYYLSKDAREGIKEFTLTPQFRQDLFDFQQTAVKIAAKYLNNERRGGAMIGDVVGLGKTITACAIAKLYEMTFASSTLIICPANLQTMWQKYVRKYDLKADVLSMARSIDPDTSRYYRLIIVDESHNLRNASGTRYQRIRQLIEHLDSKVLLLTATPYNKDFADLGSQLRLFISDDQDLGIRPEAYIRQLGNEREFQRHHPDIHIRSIKAFEQSDQPDDWSELMKLFLVRRTRTFIKENYARTDPDNGRKYLQFPDGKRSYFPERVTHSVRFQVEPGDQFSRLYSAEMVSLMEQLQLPRYGLIQYFDEKKAPEILPQEQQLVDNLSRAGQRMQGFCKSTFFKRMDSSGYSFLLTLYRHILRNAIFLYAIRQKEPLPISDENELPDEFLLDDDQNRSLFEEDPDKVGEAQARGEEIAIPTDMEVYMQRAATYYRELQKRDNCAWLPSTYFRRTLKQRLEADCRLLIAMLQLCGPWRPADDRKLQELERKLRGEHREDKVLIFTQYSDTAEYIYRQLRKRGFSRIGLATGGSQNPTDIVEHFSPVSNEMTYPPAEQLQVLIATDVLSEGQNLQDAHVIMNWDLPWAIIRLIQRAGRVDRIGQTAQQIDCYSFFPAEGLEELIRLRQRLNERINENAQIVGSDEVFFEGNEENLRNLYNEKSGALDEADDSEVDLSSQAYQIWKNATDANPRLKEIIPQLNHVIYSTKQAVGAQQEGVITYAKTYNDYDVLTWLNAEGEVVSQSQKTILGALACQADTPCRSSLDNHHELVAQAVARINQEADKGIGGMLGNRFSTRTRVVKLLETYVERKENIFFTPEKKEQLKLAIDDIYNSPLQEGAKFTLGRLLRTVTSDELVECVLDMHNNGTLCRKSDSDLPNKEPSIICSMGLRTHA